MYRLLLSSPLLLASLSVAAAAQLPEGYILVAHRGVVDDAHPENSLASLEETIRRGYTHVEVDIRITKDGHAVVLHDRTLKRTTGINKDIYRITLAELRELVPEERVPSFETFCARCEGRIDLMPDIKDFPPDLRDALGDSIERSMRKHGLVKNALFIGRKDFKDRFWGEGRVSWRKPIDEIEFDGDAAKNPGKYYFVFGHAVDFNAENVPVYQKLGLQIVVSINLFHYTKGDPVAQGLADVEKMRELGVDGLQIDSEYDKGLVN
jgi:hypothetical protein